jgi:hypothetical protein
MAWMWALTGAAVVSFAVDSAQRHCERWAYERDKDL